MQAYSNPKRESDPHALPDVEVFYVSPKEAAWYADKVDNEAAAFPCEPEVFYCTEPGWHWWSCFPGCLPDSDPIGPFATEAEALADAQDGGE